MMEGCWEGKGKNVRGVYISEGRRGITTIESRACTESRELGEDNSHLSKEFYNV